MLRRHRQELRRQRLGLGLRDLLVGVVDRPRRLAVGYREHVLVVRQGGRVGVRGGARVDRPGLGDLDNHRLSLFIDAVGDERDADLVSGRPRREDQQMLSLTEVLIRRGRPVPGGPEIDFHPEPRGAGEIDVEHDVPVALGAARVVDRYGERRHRLVRRVQDERRRIVEHPAVRGAQRALLVAGSERERDGNGAIRIGRADFHAPVVAEQAAGPALAVDALRLHDLPVGDGEGVIAHVLERNRNRLVEPEIEAVVETPARDFRLIEFLERRGEGDCAAVDRNVI